MSTYTENLNLFKYDTSTDGKEVFSIDTAMNANWDKIDSLVVKKSGDTMTGILDNNYQIRVVDYDTGNRTDVNKGSLELYSTTPYIDFHYNGNKTVDFTSRIIEESEGVLRFGGKGIKGSIIAAVGMPSNNYIELTLGTTGAYYSSPANGYYTLWKRSTGVNQVVHIYNTANAIGFTSYATANGQTLSTSCFVKQGDIVKINYSAGGTVDIFRFIYAEGEG